MAGKWGLVGLPGRRHRCAPTHGQCAAAASIEEAFTRSASGQHGGLTHLLSGVSRYAINARIRALPGNC
jgi:hypothetical protein